MSKTADIVLDLEAAGYRRVVTGEFGFFKPGLGLASFVNAAGSLIILSEGQSGENTKEGEALLQAIAKEYS